MVGFLLWLVGIFMGFGGGYAFWWQQSLAKRQLEIQDGLMVHEGQVYTINRIRRNSND